jgi:hypothetical protein
MRILLLAGCMKIILLAGCSSTFSSNPGVFVTNKVENSIRKGSVKTYTNAEVWEQGALQVGYVEASYCQVDFRDRKASKNSLISSLKIKAQKLGGNALVFDACIVNSHSASCLTHTKCRGIAYLVNR